MAAPLPAAGSNARTSTRLRFIDQYLRQAPRGSLTGLLLGQLDAFNRISTTFGLERARQFCTEYTDNLKGSLPPGTPVIRLSERRFIVLLQLDSVVSVMDEAARLTEESQMQVEVGDDRFLVDLTLGVAVHPTHADDAASLFRRAELALEEARKNEVAFDVYCPETTQQHAALWKLESDLDRAIHDGDLELYFQPQVDVVDYRVEGVEALSRWRSSSGAFVPAQQFVPLAERSGSIVPLTWFVFERVEASIPRWSELPRPFRVAVNIAPQVLSHSQFFDRLTRLAEAMQAADLGLTLELTEDRLVQCEDAAPLLRRVRKLGVGIAIDDFGKGYSSLGYLKEMPANELKIDKRFVSAAATDQKDRQIVKVVAELAHVFDMRVVAEGVDSDECLQAVAELGCESAQGYFIARPMRADLIAGWIGSFERGARRGSRAAPLRRGAVTVG
ncbi:MAG: EAL domain-containing protein [Gammaproteobacteria bacterium]|nr:EAL domain-containing protein [Gammaproteobacteria bacterium]